MKELLRWGIEELSEAEIPTAKLDAEVLLGAVLGLTRSQVLARSHTPMQRHQRGRFAALIQRRKRGEPVAYILGRQEFYGREFLVDRRVLIPRPETEELVDHCLNALEGRVTPRVADIGTGSGAIAITIAAERADAVVLASDVSSGALGVARENAQRYTSEGRIDFRQGSLLDPLAGATPLDLIVANLPYVGTSEIDILAADVRDYEPHEALFAGPEGLDLFPLLFEQLRDHALLKPDGALWLEMGYAQGAALARMARLYFPNAHKVAVHTDLAHHDRFVELNP
ncbi:MAG: peptide chain release factor N(5)-glutamine methyltransferase [Ardenticatenales bacterium]|nr:peptide chain release factor N(5)-glutamine methyltransferase [Ardenticatenales bacterium]